MGHPPGDGLGAPHILGLICAISVSLTLHMGTRPLSFKVCSRAYKSATDHKPLVSSEPTQEYLSNLTCGAPQTDYFLGFC